MTCLLSNELIYAGALFISLYDANVHFFAIKESDLHQQTRKCSSGEISEKKSHAMSP
jgi:hypothetical protein